MLPKPETCYGCPLFEKGHGFSNPDGLGTNGVLLVGEALGRTEALQGIPFVGEAGHQLNRTLGRTRVQRKDFKIWNVVACQPPNNWLEGAPWQEGATAHCSQYLHQVIQEMQPKVVVPMGGVALKAILGLDGIMDKRAPKRGYVYKVGDIHYVPTVHPSFVMQGNAKLTGVQAYDILRAVRVAKEGYHEPAYCYYEHPTDAVCQNYIKEAKLTLGNSHWMAVDIETADSGKAPEDELTQVIDANITRISFSCCRHEAITIPWENHYLGYIQELLNLPGFKVFWNEKFDVPRIKGKGLTINGSILDAMYMWHYLQSDLPKGLGFVGSLFTELPEWKSKSDEFPEFYSCRDADATFQIALAIRDALLDQERLGGFFRHHTHLEPILTEMGRAGILIDKQKKEEFKQKMVEEKRRLEDGVQSAVPDELRPFKPRRKVPGGAVLGEPAGPAKDRGVWDYDRTTGEWGIRRPFLHGSHRQVIAYMRFKGHPVPRNYKTGRDTTGADEIERLAKRYPKDALYQILVQARETDKVISQYLNGYEPDSDGRLRTTFTQKPSTWRTATENPNIQNVRRRWHLANEYRRMFIAGQGMLLAENDYKAIEAVITGQLAKDMDYVKAAKLGVHAILMAHVMEHPLKDWWAIFPEPTVKETITVLKKENKKLYEMCKTIVHMSNYGGTAKKIMMDNNDQFKTIKEAQELQDIYFGTIGKRIKTWQAETLKEAHTKGFLQNPYGYRHYYYDVLNWDPASKSWSSWGSDAKRCLSFLPQSTAAGVIKEAILRFGQRIFYRKSLRWMIHDSLIFELPNDRLLQTRLLAIKEEMERPVPQLGNLSIEVETSIGPSWGEMAEWHG